MEMWLKNLTNDLFSDIFPHYFAISQATNAITHIGIITFLERYYHFVLYVTAFLPSI